MPRSPHLKTIAWVALNALAFVVFVAWFWHPARVLGLAAGPDGATVARDGELAWTLNLPLADTAKAPLPTMTPAVPGAFAWRDARTVVFTPAGPLPAGGSLSVAFPEDLRAAGGFRFDPDHLPVRSVTTLPALAVTGASAAAPAFGDGAISLALSRVPADTAALVAAVTVSPDVRFRAAVADGRLVLTGAFAPGTTYRVAVADSVPGRADDRPLAWRGEVAVPARTPGARLVDGVRQGAPEVEAVGLAELTVELAGGSVPQVLHPVAGADGVARAVVPAWLLRPGENRLVLRWAGGSAEVACVRRDLPVAPEDATPVLTGGGIPVVSQR